MSSEKKIKSALISVFYKEGLEPVVRKLSELNVEIFSTGGTADFIRNCGVEVTDVEEITDYPSILGGRVKTLHPKIFGGILARRGNLEDIQHLEEFGIPEIDLIIVDLYPFEETLRTTADEQLIIEKIDIGGISLIRAAAKNYKDTFIVASRDHYPDLLELLNQRNGATSLEERKHHAAVAFAITSHYDTAIFNYFNKDLNIPNLRQSYSKHQSLRYGENPHQQALFYGNLDEMFDKLHGKELSYNNLVDIDAAVNLIDEFDEPTFGILKHTNSCGLASRENLKDAWEAALAGDPVSAFGGIVITNQKIDTVTAGEINKLFVEVVIAPDYDQEGLGILQSKKNRIILKRKKVNLSKRQFKTLLNGIIEQDKDLKTEDAGDLKPVTDKKPSASQIEDLIFANKAVKHLKSNGIALVKNKQLIGIGTGQTSRVDALNQAIHKAKQFGFHLNGAVMASDAFFPFPDCVEIAHKAGISAVVQPGGSVKDQDSIDYCNKNDIAMVMTGSRHFKH